jgi:hypothetical protein
MINKLASYWLRHGIYQDITFINEVRLFLNGVLSLILTSTSWRRTPQVFTLTGCILYIRHDLSINNKQTYTQTQHQLVFIHCFVTKAVTLYFH